MEPFLEALGHGYMQRAMAAGLLVGLTCPAIGLYLVLRRLSLIGDGFGHLSFAGVSGGWLVGVHPTLGAAVFAVVGAFGMERLRAWRRESGDLALAMVFYAGIALGVVFAGLSRHLNLNLLGYLFGSILTVTELDLAVMGSASVLVWGAVLLLRDSLFALAYDEESARVAGLPIGLLNHLVLLLAALTVVASLRVVGILLVAGMLVVPVATSLQIGRDFQGTQRWAMVFGGISTVAGLFFAYAFDLAPGGTILLTAILVFVLTSLAREASARLRRRPA